MLHVKPFLANEFNEILLILSEIASPFSLKHFFVTSVKRNMKIQEHFLYNRIMFTQLILTYIYDITETG